ncbi:MAG: aminoacyl-tRNA hydrolase [Spirochaetes bacterium]|nr:aminoacyl-tRNA hydrolase [Spirochaetota bacterium]
MMVVISFLGNPGMKYRRNRHNIGFIIGAHLADTWGIRVSKSAFSAFCGTGQMESRDLLLMMPQTYMNQSGGPVKQALAYHRVDPSSLIVVHDEIELPFGDFRIKTGGGHKGHNGLRSIIEQLGTPDFRRLRFGVGRPDNQMLSVADYVLSDFSSDEMARIEALLPEIDSAVRGIIASL